MGKLVACSTGPYQQIYAEKELFRILPLFPTIKNVHTVLLVYRNKTCRVNVYMLLLLFSSCATAHVCVDAVFHADFFSLP